MSIEISMIPSEFRADVKLAIEVLREHGKDAARETSVKDYRINIRISKRDVEALKTKAMEV